MQRVANTVRELLGSREAASHFRVATRAFEFNVFAKGGEDLIQKRRILEEKGFHVIAARILDETSRSISMQDALGEGVELFDEERFWECHEVLEQAWRHSQGDEKQALQSLILTAAAFVHYQKNEPDICLSVLKRARAKMNVNISFRVFDFAQLKGQVDSILDTGKIRLFTLRTSQP